MTPPPRNNTTTRKRHRVIPSRLSSDTSLPSSSRTLRSSQKLRRSSSSTSIPTPATTTTTTAAADIISFNDPSTADVILRLYHDSSSPFKDDDDDCGESYGTDRRGGEEEEEVRIYLHSDVLRRRAKYFTALLSDRWRSPETGGGQTDGYIHLNLAVTVGAGGGGSIATHLAVLELLYTDGFDDVIDSASTALDILPVALELLFDDCVRSCVRYLEAVPWTEEEEKRVMTLVPFLREEESRDLVARVSPSNDNSREEMLHGLILAATNGHPNMAFVKAFVAKLLRDLTSKETARKVLERAFVNSLKVVTESLEEYSSPDFRGDHNETEAIQRLNLHKAMTNLKHLVWLVERMIELRVADRAAKEWSEQPAFTADLQRAFREDAWRNIVPGLPPTVMRCTWKLANAVATGTILAPRQVRMKLVKDWLPVLIVCKDNVYSPMLPSQKPLFLELEETFLRIISTLPVSDSQELLQQCLSFSTRNAEDCPHLVTAFNTWFRRAGQPPQVDSLE